MKVLCIPLCADGALKPRETWAANKQAGNLSVREERDPERHRTVRTAWFRDGAHDIIPPLHDAQLLECNDDRMVLSGYERLPQAFTVACRGVAQTWLVYFAEREDAERWAEQRATHLHMMQEQLDEREKALAAREKALMKNRTNQ